MSHWGKSSGYFHLKTMEQAQAAEPTAAMQVLRLPQQGLTNESSIGLSINRAQNNGTVWPSGSY